MFVFKKRFLNLSIKKFKIKFSLYSRYYAEACNEWRVHLCDLTPGQHSFEETSQRWRTVDDTVSDLTGPVIKPQASRTDSVRLATELTGRLFSSKCLTEISTEIKVSTRSSSQQPHPSKVSNATQPEFELVKRNCSPCAAAKPCHKL